MRVFYIYPYRAKRFYTKKPETDLIFFFRTGKKTMLSVLFFVSLITFIQSGTFLAAQGTYIRNSESKKGRQEIYCDSVVKSAMVVLYSNPDSARVIVENALKHIEDEENSGISRLYNTIGATYHLQANYGQALDNYYLAVSYALKMNDTIRLADVYNNIGIVNLKTGNYKDALEFFLKAVQQYERSGLQRNAASAYNNIGLLYNDINNSDKAKQNFQIALKGFKSLGDSIGISAALSNIGLMYSNTLEDDSTLSYFNKAAEIARINNNLYGLLISYQGMANFHLAKESYKIAYYYYENSRDYSRTINQPYQEAFAILGLSNVLLAEDKLDEALKFAKEASVKADLLDNTVLRYQCHEVLSNIYEKKQDLEKSLENYKIYSKLKDELVNQTILHQIYNLEISTLNETNALQQLQIERQRLSISKKNNLLFFIIIAFALLIIGLYLLYLNYKHIQQSKLQKTIIGLNEKKSRAAIEAEIQERQRIGKELHDGLGQMLSVARLHISVVQQKKHLPESRKEELLEAAIHSVDEAFNELRNISHNLAPSLLSEKGLEEAIRSLSNHINKSSQLKMEFEAFGITEGFDSLIEHTLFRAIQELLNNAITHSKATIFTVQLIKSKSEITLMVEDNGSGFNVNAISNLTNRGINNIRSRIENLNGTIFIDSMTNRGTIISIVLPTNKLDEKTK
ncbi:MAG: hypothetical protein CVT92_01045 [Bacteroidetes bacterium HGW-Bacteroidetes-1]|jgi:signal transduction histidine kinase|nr:MAG: hypothetical protein CVT92_01045 [Bacteroidetes bacterium HGW-Bacteroidetes-1]